MPRARFFLPFALLPLALIWGCGPKLQQVGGLLPKSLPGSIISLSPSTTEILATQGTLNQLRGRTASCDYPASVKNIPVYGGVKPDYEKIRAAKPDLVVYDSSLYSPADIAKLKDAVGSDRKLFDCQADTVDQFESKCRALGQVLFASMTMSTYIDKINRERNAAKTDVPGSPPKIAVLDGTMIDGTKSFLADVIRGTGGEPVGPDANRFVVLNPETLIQSNPDIIVVAVDVAALGADQGKRVAVAQKAVDALLTDARYRSVKAVQAKRIYPVDSEVLLRQGSRVDALVANVAKIVHGAAGGQ